MIAHYRQLRALLEAEGPCFIGDPDENTSPPYTFIWGIDADRNALTAAGEVDTIDEYFKVSCVAETGNNALSLAERVIAHLITAQLTVPGWRTFPLPEHEISLHGPLAQRGVFEEPTNRYPSLVVLDARLQATKE